MVAFLENQDEYPQESSKTLQDYLSLFQRRFGSIVVIASLVLLIFVAIAVLWPPTYRSTATILIEEQDIPSDLVRSTITSFADQRIQVISTRVMTRTNLLSIIDQYNLYEDERRYETNEELVERMREDTKLDVISADVMDPVSRRPIVATIAFHLAYDGDRAETVLNVANKLTSLYLDENLKTRAQKAAQTSQFLAAEAKQLSASVSGLEKKIADFKEKHGEKLPEFKELNFQLLERIEREMVDTENQIRALKDRKFYLEGQLAQINPASPMFSANGERILSPEDQLKVLETEILRMGNKYRSDHPDLVEMKREIESLKNTISASPEDNEKMKELTRLRTALASRLERYTATHPEIVRLKKAISTLESTPASEPPTPDKIKVESELSPENPAFITLQAQLNSVNDEIIAYQRRFEKQQSKLDELEKRLIDAPMVEREFLNLSRDYENAVVKYREIRAKQLEAEIAEELEVENKGERFSLIDPPALPEEPVSPNRVAIVILGFALAISAGIGYTLISETLDGSVHSLRDISFVKSNPIMLEIPLSENRGDLLRKRRLWIIFLVSILLIAAIALILVHYFVSPLDVLSYRIERKFHKLFLF